jgi:hypothetical protein
MNILSLIIFVLGILLISFSIMIAIGILLEGPPWLNRDFKNRYLVGVPSMIMGLVLLFLSRSL